MQTKLKYRKAGYRAWPVTVTLHLCDEASGAVVEEKACFVAHFTHFSEAGYVAALERAKAAVPAPEGADGERLPIYLALARNAHLFAALMCGWGGEVVDDDGNPLPYSAEALAALVTGADGLAVSAGISNAIAQIRFGQAPEKNLNPSPSPGQGCGEGAAPTS